MALHSIAIRTLEGASESEWLFFFWIKGRWTQELRSWEETWREHDEGEERIIMSSESFPFLFSFDELVFVCD